MSIRVGDLTLETAASGIADARRDEGSGGAEIIGTHFTNGTIAYYDTLKIAKPSAPRAMSSN